MCDTKLFLESNFYLSIQQLKICTISRVFICMRIYGTLISHRLYGNIFYSPQNKTITDSFVFYQVITRVNN